MLPAFNHLIHLEVSGGFASDTVLAVRGFSKFLQLSPNLIKIVFAQKFNVPDEEDDGYSSLEFKNFFGERAELNAIELFLKYAGSVGTVTIVADSDLSNDYEKQTNIT